MCKFVVPIITHYHLVNYAAPLPLVLSLVLFLYLKYLAKSATTPIETQIKHIPTRKSIKNPFSNCVLLFASSNDDNQVKVCKIIRDGKMYIIRGNQVYDMLGTRL